MSWWDLKYSEKKDLNMISSAYFDLFSGNKIKPSKYQMIKWIRKYYNREK